MAGCQAAAPAWGTLPAESSMQPQPRPQRVPAAWAVGCSRCCRALPQLSGCSGWGAPCSRSPTPQCTARGSSPRSWAPHLQGMGVGVGVKEAPELLLGWGMRLGGGRIDQDATLPSRLAPVRPVPARSPPAAVAPFKSQSRGWSAGVSPPYRPITMRPAGSPPISISKKTCGT